MSPNSAAGLTFFTTSLRAFAPSRETNLLSLTLGSEKEEEGVFTRRREGAKKIFGRYAAEGR